MNSFKIVYKNYCLDLEKENPLKTLKEFIKNNRKCVSLKNHECVLLDTLIDFLIDHKENQRSLDEFSSIFLFYVKVNIILTKN